MEDRAMTQYLIGGIALIVGLSGWLLPYRWNILRLKRSFAKRFSDEINEKIPKVVGTILLVIGVITLVATVLGHRFQ